MLSGDIATITRRSARVKETMTGKIGADGRVTLEGGGVTIDESGRWRYRFEGRFDDDKFEARGVMLSASGASKIRECTMTLTRTSPAVRQASSANKEQATSPTAAAPEPAPIAATPETALQPPAAEQQQGADVPAAPIAAENKVENRHIRYSREDRILLALFVGIAAAGIGVILYDWRRPTRLTPTNAVAAIVAAGLSTAGLAWYAFSHLNL